MYKNVIDAINSCLSHNEHNIILSHPLNKNVYLCFVAKQPRPIPNETSLVICFILKYF